MIQTVVLRSGNAEFDAIMRGFGTVIVDEAHHIAAPWFGKALFVLPARHVLGLSATPNRGDGLGFVLPWLLGPVAFSAARDDAGGVDVEVLVYRNQETQVERLDRGGHVREGLMTTLLGEDVQRTSLLVHHITRLALTGRRLFVVADRTELLRVLENALLRHPGVLSLSRHTPPQNVRVALPKMQGAALTKALLDTGVPASLVVGCVSTKEQRELWKSHATAIQTKKRKRQWEIDVLASFTVGVVVGGVKPAVRDLAFKASVILTTYAYAAEGVDIPELDTVVLATPRSQIEQTVGRILRPCASKQSPLVIDIKDAFSLYEGMAWKRHRFYTKQKYNVRVHE
jgi:superfamily II DNA or RNA helicase